MQAGSDLSGGLGALGSWLNLNPCSVWSDTPKLFDFWVGDRDAAPSPIRLGVQAAKPAEPILDSMNHDGPTWLVSAALALAISEGLG